MNFCPWCGHSLIHEKLSGNLCFCPWCGHKLITQENHTTYEEPEHEIPSDIDVVSSRPTDKKQRRVKTVKCRICGQKTIVDETSCCQWCQYPLSAKLHKEREEKTKEYEGPRAPRKRHVGRVIAVFVTILCLSVGGYLLVSTGVLDWFSGAGGAYHTEIQRVVDPPRPIIVHEDTVESVYNNDYTIKATCQVRNEGGSGWIAVEATLHAYGEHYNKETKIHLDKGQQKVVDFYFTEVTIEGRMLQVILDIIGVNSRDIDGNPDVDVVFHTYASR